MFSGLMVFGEMRSSFFPKLAHETEKIVQKRKEIPLDAACDGEICCGATKSTLAF